MTVNFSADAYLHCHQRQRLQLAPADYRVVVTMFDRRNRIHLQTLEDIRAEFGQAEAQTMFEVDT